MATTTSAVGDTEQLALAPSHRPALERPAADPLSCHYGCGRNAVAKIDLAWGSIGWCSKHLASIGDWPARMWEDM